MAVKAETAEIATAPVTYPKLMKSTVNGTIVLFSSYKCGTVVSDDGKPYNESIGYYCDGWSMANFKDYNGSVILTND